MELLPVRILAERHTDGTGRRVICNRLLRRRAAKWPASRRCHTNGADGTETNQVGDVFAPPIEHVVLPVQGADHGAATEVRRDEAPAR